MSQNNKCKYTVCPYNDTWLKIQMNNPDKSWEQWWNMMPLKALKHQITHHKEIDNTPTTQRFFEKLYKRKATKLGKLLYEL